MPDKPNTADNQEQMSKPKIDVLVVGAGFAGMYAVHRFRNQGLKVQVFEAGSDVGGTWYWNRYPGARCDVPSLEYSYGFSKELQDEWDWPEVFSSQVDILAYANFVADKFDLRKDIQFNTRVNAVTWLEKEGLWQLSTESGEEHRAQFCVMATGCLSVPNTPELPGAENFEGEVLHTGLWPKEPVDLSTKRVGVIGTGSSGVQSIPELAEQSAHLTVFQRTPVYTVPANRKAMRADIQDEFRNNFETIRKLQQNNTGGISNFRRGRPSDSNTKESDRTSVLVTGVGSSAENQSAKAPGIKDLTESERRAIVEHRGPGVLLSYRDVYNDPEANEIANDLYRGFVAREVDDPDTAESLMPRTYGIGCKRQVLDRDYYPTFNRDNVSLVDVQKTPIDKITARGIKTNETEHELDVLVYATGFDAMTGALLRANITGRDGQTLNDKWRYGPVAFLGLQMSGFPNLFTVTGPGSPSVLCNMFVAIEQHLNWIGDCIDYLRGKGLQSIEPMSESEQRWIAHVNEVAEGTTYTAPSCNSWYLGANIPGKTRIFMPYVGGYPRYKAHCDHESDNNYEGFALA